MSTWKAITGPLQSLHLAAWEHTRQLLAVVVFASHFEVKAWATPPLRRVRATDEQLDTVRADFGLVGAAELAELDGVRRLVVTR